VNQPLETLQSRWKLDLAKDIFAWVKGEYAIGLLPAQEAVNPTDREQKQTSRGRSRKAPSSNPAFPLPENDWIFVAQRTRTESTKQAIAHLDEIAKQQGYGVGELQLGDQRVSAWTRLNTGRQISSKTLEAEVQGVHASVGNYEIFTTSVTAMEAVLQSIDRSLLNQSSFEQAIAPFLQPNNGYLYLDWNQSRPILEHQFPILKVIQLAGQPLFSHLKSLTVSSYGSQSGVQRAGLFINLS
jgi:hypothetical protein